MIIIQKKEVRTMEKAKDYFLRFLITAIMWIVSRFIPSIIQNLFNIQGGTILSAAFFMGLLVLAWYLAGSISKWKYPKTIETNLTILGMTQGFGIVFLILGFISGSSANLLTLVLSIAAPGIYIWLCYFLTGEAKSKYKTIYQSKKP